MGIGQRLQKQQVRVEARDRLRITFKSLITRSAKIDRNRRQDLPR